MDDNVNTYISCGEIFSKISDITRIIDPLQKRVVEYKNEDVVIDEIHCFDFWGNQRKYQ